METSSSSSSGLGVEWPHVLGGAGFVVDVVVVVVVVLVAILVLV